MRKLGGMMKKILTTEMMKKFVTGEETLKCNNDIIVYPYLLEEILGHFGYVEEEVETNGRDGDYWMNVEIEGVRFCAQGSMYYGSLSSFYPSECRWGRSVKEMIEDPEKRFDDFDEWLENVQSK